MCFGLWHYVTLLLLSPTDYCTVGSNDMVVCSNFTIIIYQSVHEYCFKAVQGISRLRAEKIRSGVADVIGNVKYRRRGW